MLRFSLSSACIALAFIAGSYAAVGPVTDLRLVNGAVTPDGFTRQAVLAGGTFPGPLITGKKGDQFQINVIDDLTNATMLKTTSIHWHGLFQHGTTWADGVAFVSQCPIASGNSFLYDFSVPGQAGTYWYHSHLAVQYCDGLRGPLVIYDPHDPHAYLYDVDNDSTVITLADWYHVAATLGPRFPDPDTALINGLGRFPGGPAANLSVITVQHGKRYRFRLVSISCNPTFTFSIDNHNMTVIEADAQNTRPLVVDQIQIFPAQRYSFVLAANQPVGNYWIRSLADSGVQSFDGGINSAILHYVGAPNVEPNTTQTGGANPLVEANLHPLVNPAAPGKPYPGGADVHLDLNLTFNGTYFAINGATFIPPTVPVLLQVLSGAQRAQDLLPPGSVITLPGHSSVIEITFTGDAFDGPHPFHLHGHAFSVVRSAGQAVPNYVNPVRRDTVSAGNPGDNVTIRYVTDNPGPWFLHCHIDFHLNAGLAIVLVEDVGNIAQTNPVPQSWKDLCPIYDALAPGNH